MDEILVFATIKKSAIVKPDMSTYVDVSEAGNWQYVFSIILKKCDDGRTVHDAESLRGKSPGSCKYDELETTTVSVFLSSLRL